MPEPTSSEQGQPVAQPANPDRATIETELLNQIFEGKNFKSVDEAKTSYWNLNQYASQAYKELSSRVDPTAVAAQRPDPLQRLEKEAYIPMDAFTEAVDQRVNDAIERAFKPITGAMEARTALATEMPSYLTNEQAIQAWLGKNPSVAAEVRSLNSGGFFVQAAKLATYAYNAAQPIASPGDPGAKSQASLPNSGNPQARTVDGSNSEDLMHQALAYSARTGDKRPALTMLFPDFEATIPEHLKQR